jgi:hypothetical protein
MDGAVADPQGRENCGGILRNSVGNFIVAFSAYIGSCSVLHSEIGELLTVYKLLKPEELCVCVWNRILLWSSIWSRMVIIRGISYTLMWMNYVSAFSNPSKHNFLNQLWMYTNYLINSLSILTSSLHIDKSKTS